MQEKLEALRLALSGAARALEHASTALCMLPTPVANTTGHIENAYAAVQEGADLLDEILAEITKAMKGGDALVYGY